MEWKEGIFFKEIKSYEEAYYYNSDPNNRIMYKKDKYELNDMEEKRKSKALTILEIIFNIVEGIV